jgi:hypothetical protein
VKTSPSKFTLLAILLAGVPSAWGQAGNGVSASLVSESNLPAAAKSAGGPIATAQASPSPSEIASLESEIEQLRELIESQSKKIQAQDENLRAEEERVSLLESDLPKPTAEVLAASADTNSREAAPPPAEQALPGPSVIPAITPSRVFPVGGIQREALKPAFTVAGVRVTPYGFFKATSIHDSSSPNGDDFPLPGFLGDSGPTAAPEFHIKARSSRFGTNFEWLDPSSKFTITGKLEFDFEGNFSRADNRNLSSIRSSMPSLRLAYGRLDYKVNDNNTFSALFGQDWTPFSSSTLPNLLETTGLGIGFGVLWERDPQMRFGWTHNAGWFQVMNEFALVLPASGDTPAAADLVNQLGYGERQGADSARPSVQDRIVFQWQLDHAPGVAPAQLIVSGEQGTRTAIVLKSAVPAAYAADFPTGATVSSNTDGWTGEFQLPTRYATVIGKYYGGSDLRWFFGGQLFSNFNDTAGLTAVATAPSIDGASTVAFGLNGNGVAVVAPQRPLRAAGGFASLGLPISRILGADPHGRNTGWTAYFTYGGDQAKTRDLLRLEPDGSRQRSDMTVGTLYYKLNNWVSFGFEESLYRTRANTVASGLPLFMGLPSHEWKDLRSEGGTIFTF